MCRCCLRPSRVAGGPARGGGGGSCTSWCRATPGPRGELPADSTCRRCVGLYIHLFDRHVNAVSSRVGGMGYPERLPAARASVASGAALCKNQQHDYTWKEGRFPCAGTGPASQGLDEEHVVCAGVSWGSWHSPASRGGACNIATIYNSLSKKANRSSHTAAAPITPSAGGMPAMPATFCSPTSVLHREYACDARGTPMISLPGGRHCNTGMTAAIQMMAVLCSPWRGITRITHPASNQLMRYEQPQRA
jgi:hypothetical protein